MAVPTTGTATARHALAGLAAVALALAACGSSAAGRAAGGAAATPGPPSAQALLAVRGAVAGMLSRTAAVSMAITGGTLFGASASSVTATGAFDFAALRGSLTFTPSGTKAGEPVVFTPTAVYVRPPAAGGLLPAGKSWTVADFADAEAVTSSFPQLIAQAESVNPALTISELLWGAVAAAPAGPDTVVTVDLNRAVAAASGPAQVPFGRAIASEIVALGGSVGGASRPVTLDVRTTVAGTGRLLRVVLTPPGAGVGSLTMSLGSRDGPVRADPPPSAQVVDVLALGPGGERENQGGGDSDGG